jgi:Ca2+-binding RTX toxin-like protein
MTTGTGLVMSRLAIALLAAPLALLAPLPASARPAPDRPSCAVQPGTAITMTVDADDPAVVMGTEGSDVIEVLGGTHEVRTLGGNDAVCFVRGATVTSVDLGPGDDQMGLLDAAAAAPHTLLQGGAGDDQIVTTYDRTVDLDLFAGDLTAVSTDGTSSYAAEGFEDANVSSGSVSLKGNQAGNELLVYACSARVTGGRGSDTVRLVTVPAVPDFDPTPDCRGVQFHLSARGGPGNDRLTGRRWDDVLIGGKGRDVATGRGGHDVCRTEVVLDCRSKPT